MPSIEVARFNPNNKGFDKPTIKQEVSSEDFILIHNYIKDAKQVHGFYKVTIFTDTE